MSEKAPIVAAVSPAKSSLESHYKPVGIAALTAATLCAGHKTEKKNHN
ncbi:hypothetical protein [Labrenzia sp. CE80]|nr:hypothetical protein [Labrenzia sp. CE80]